MSLTRTLADDTWLRPFFTQYRKAMLASLGLGVAAMVFACGLMFVSGYLIDLSSERPAQGVWALSVPLAFVQLFGIGKPFLSYFERLVSHDWVLHMTSQLRRRLFRAVDGGGTLFLSMRSAGEALGLLSDDIAHIQNLYLRSIFPQVVACALWLALSIALGVFSPLLGVVTLFVVGMLVVVVPLVAGVVNGARNMRRKALDAQLYTSVYDNVQGVADWMFSQREDAYTARIAASRAEKDALDSALAVRARWRDLGVQLVFCAASVGLLVWAALYFGGSGQGVAGVENITRPVNWAAAFVLGFFPLAEAFTPLSAGAVQLSAHLDSIERLNALERDTSGSAPVQPAQGETGAPAKPSIRIEGLRYSYPGEQRHVLNGIDLDIPFGQKVAVLGPSGSGKSTLCTVVRGDAEPSEGVVEIGGRLASSLGDEASRLMSVIQQDTYLFNATLFDNLAMQDERISREQATAALERVGLADLLSNLPMGLDTMVDEAGMRFSGGERHRIALARALLQDSPIVLLDEPCASLDPMTERALLETLLEVFADRTVVMVTHHLLGIGAFDRVVFVEDGAVTLDGDPRTLATTSARFAELIDFDRGAD